MASIGFLGLGNMGRPMAENLVKAGHQVRGFDLSAAALDAFATAGGIAAKTAAEAVADAEIIVSMLPAGPHVRSAYTAQGGVLDAAAQGALLIDCSTIDVDSARVVAAIAAERGFAMIDAPVSGGTGGAEAGTLTFMVGGEADAVERARPYLEKMGKTIVHCGGAGTEPGGQDLQQHDPRHHHDGGQRGLRARRKARPRCPEAVRCQLEILGPVLVAHDLLPGARPGTDLAGQSRLPAGLYR